MQLGLLKEEIPRILAVLTGAVVMWRDCHRHKAHRVRFPIPLNCIGTGIYIEFRTKLYGYIFNVLLFGITFDNLEFGKQSY